MNDTVKKDPYTRYPLLHVLLYNGTTLAHFILGGAGLYLSYENSWLGTVLALVYLVYAFGQMVVVMPVRVCPNCPYYRMDDARCISALNLLARRIAPRGKPQNFRRRSKGPLCHNNQYFAALLIQLPLMLIGVIINFSVALLALLLIEIALVLFRVFVLFMRVACPNCAAKQRCPNAEQLGIS